MATGMAAIQESPRLVSVHLWFNRVGLRGRQVACMGLPMTQASQKGREASHLPFLFPLACEPAWDSRTVARVITRCLEGARL